MESTFLLTVDAPSPYKFLFVALLLLVGTACNDTAEPTFQCQGIDVDAAEISVSQLSLDSTLYASGDFLWFLNGSVQVDGHDEPFQLVFDQNPITTNSKPIQYDAPLLTEDIQECVFTREYGVCRITWRGAKQHVYVKSSITSGR